MIHLIATGGTIDKDAHPLTSSLDFVGGQVDAALRAAGLDDDQIVVQQLFLLDSLDMTPEHREAIANACATSPNSNLIVTHGTDTMNLTARHLSTDPRLSQKVIILTGAMRPLSMRVTDGQFNLGMAYAAARLLPSGVYIAMSGEVLPWQNLQKDRQKGRFLRTSVNRNPAL